MVYALTTRGKVTDMGEKKKPKVCDKNVFDTCVNSMVTIDGPWCMKQQAFCDGTCHGYTWDEEDHMLKPKDVDCRYYVPFNPTIAATSDAVNHPSHYCKGSMEFWDAMKELLTRDEYIGALKYNAMKYIYRCPDKDNAIQDLDKSIAFITKLKELFNEEKDC